MARRRPPLRRQLALIARWPAGIALTSWRYMWRTTPLYRSETLGSPAEDLPPELPAGTAIDDLQRPDDGVGPLFHRRYRVRILGSRLSAEELVAQLREDPDRASPSEFASFNRLTGAGVLSVGDEWIVRMPGPWDGPVRVIDATPTSFRLATLAGHLEAGQIEFRAASEDGDVVFTIESWARSGDRLCDLLYHRARMAKEIQLHMWTSFLERVVKLSGGRRERGIEIHTRRVEGGEGSATLGDRRARRALDALHAQPLNFDLDAVARREPGWLIDDYRRELPRGGFDVAKRLMQSYEFADPEVVRAVYHPDSPFEGRDMLLELRFKGLRFHVGVRVAGVIDETGGDVTRYGFSYQTLQGHLEMGQMDYELRERHDTGAVEFRIHVVSKAARIRNPLVRIGFRLFGRREQTRFARTACDRMAALTAAELRHGEGAAPVPRAAGRVAVEPASTRGPHAGPRHAARRR